MGRRLQGQNTCLVVESVGRARRACFCSAAHGSWVAVVSRVAIAIRERCIVTGAHSCGRVGRTLVTPAAGLGCIAIESGVAEARGPILVCPHRAVGIRTACLTWHPVDRIAVHSLPACAARCDQGFKTHSSCMTRYDLPWQCTTSNIKAHVA
jgi:hypothetical protein